MFIKTPVNVFMRKDVYILQCQAKSIPWDSVLCEIWLIQFFALNFMWIFLFFAGKWKLSRICNVWYRLFKIFRRQSAINDVNFWIRNEHATISYIFHSNHSIRMKALHRCQSYLLTFHFLSLKSCEIFHINKCKIPHTWI